MKFDDIDGPIEDLLYEDADFRFFDRQLKMAAQMQELRTVREELAEARAEQQALQERKREVLQREAALNKQVQSLKKRIF